jgi:CRISPR-associated protein Csm4
LFGQLCWAIRLRYGEEKLRSCLTNYADNKPFLILSDAFPKDCFPKPELPMAAPWASSENADFKAWNRRKYLPKVSFEGPLINASLGDNTAALFDSTLQPHNSINRLTGTTGDGFAPYTLSRLSFNVGAVVDIYILIDETIFTKDDLLTVISDTGQGGYGRDATTGLGKFSIINTSQPKANLGNSSSHLMTLAPSAPSAKQVKAHEGYWRPITRFGRHGALAFARQVFKTPILLTDTGAVFVSSTSSPPLFLGQGLGGNGSLSDHIPETVHQAYAPVISLDLTGWFGESLV